MLSPPWQQHPSISQAFSPTHYEVKMVRKNKVLIPIFRAIQHLDLKKYILHIQYLKSGSARNDAYFSVSLHGTKDLTFNSSSTYCNSKIICKNLKRHVRENLKAGQTNNEKRSSSILRAFPHKLQKKDANI